MIAKKTLKKLFALIIFFTFTAFLQSCTSLFFQPNTIDYSNFWQVKPNISEIKIKSADGKELIHWLVRADSSSYLKVKGTIVFLHGNGQNNSAYMPLIYWMTGHGYNVFMFEYRGYGNNTEKLSLDKTISDLELALDTVFSMEELGPVSLYGQSLGGSISAYVAANYKNRASFCSVVLEAPFSGYRAIVREKFSEIWVTWPFQYPFSWLVSDKYSPIDSIHKISPVPLLIIHSHSDRVIPQSHGKRLYEAALPPKEFLSVNGFHIQAMASPSVQNSILEFFRLNHRNKCQIFMYSD